MQALEAGRRPLPAGFLPGPDSKAGLQMPLDKLGWILSSSICPKSQGKKDQLDRHR